MSTQNNIYVDVIADIKGFNNLKKGENAINSLEARFKSLGKTLGVGLGAAELVKFGKDAVSAFSADNQSAKILSQTLSNLGLAFSDVHVEDFITKLSETSGVVKNDLRGAFDSLVRSTHDTIKAQDLLNLSLDVSKGTGKDLATVSAALAKAYGGNITSLSKLGTGLSKAELTSKSFVEIQTRLNQLFKGDAAIAADSYQGKIDRLKTSWDEFKITIGHGVVDAFSNLGKGSNVEAFQGYLSAAATDIANVLRGLGSIGGAIQSIIDKGSGGKSNVPWFKTLFPALAGIAEIGKSDQKKKDTLKSFTTVDSIRSQIATQQEAKRQSDAAAAAALAAQLKANKAKADQVKLENAALLLKKAGSIFDLNKIQIQAALISGAKTLSASDLARLQLKKDEADLQDAIDTKNADAVDGLVAKMNDAMTKVMTLGLQVATIPKANNPLQPVTDGALAATQAVQGLGTAILGLPSYGSANLAMGLSPTFAGSYLPSAATAQPANTNVTVVVDGQVLANAVTNTVTTNQVDSSASGVNPYFQRSGYGTAALPW